MGVSEQEAFIPVNRPGPIEAMNALGAQELQLRSSRSIDRAPLKRLHPVLRPMRKRVPVRYTLAPFIPVNRPGPIEATTKDQGRSLT